MILKKNLIFIHDSSLAIQMLSYLEQNNKNSKKINLTIIIPKGLLNKNLKKDVDIIFDSYEKKIISIKFDKIQLFTIYNFLDWFKIFKENKLRLTKVKKFININKIKLNTFDEIFYSNESISKYFLKLFKKNKTFFFHGIGDIKVFLKQDFLHKYKNLFFQFLNYKINNLELTNFYSRSACIYKNYYRKNYQRNNLIAINKNIFTKNFKNFSKIKLKQYNFDLKKKFIMILLKFPTFKVNESDNDRINYNKNYINYQLKRISNFLKNDSYNNLILLKTKKNVKASELNLINKFAKKNFVNNKFKIFIEKKDDFLNGEIIGVTKNCEFVISKRSSADIVINQVSPKKKIFQYQNILNEFEKKTKLFKNKKMDANKFNLDKYLKKYYYKEI